MLELIDVTKRYDLPADPQAVAVLDGITFKLEDSGTLAIVGPSGSGKSTLLNIIGGLDHPTTGKVLLDGSDLAGLDEKSLAQIRNRRIGFIFQLHHLLPQCTALENVLIPTIPGPAVTDRNSLCQRAESLLERVGLKDRMDYRPSRLSGGQRQRIAVARALINNPKLLLADEPTGSLDEHTSETIAELLLDLNQTDKVALIVVTHSLKLAKRIGPVKQLSQGRLSNWNS
jgi:lipoprotein-releasing system ATP-binding protein